MTHSQWQCFILHADAISHQNISIIPIPTYHVVSSAKKYVEWYMVWDVMQYAMFLLCPQPNWNTLLNSKYFLLFHYSYLIAMNLLAYFLLPNSLRLKKPKHHKVATFTLTISWNLFEIVSIHNTYWIFFFSFRMDRPEYCPERFPHDLSDFIHF